MIGNVTDGVGRSVEPRFADLRVAVTGGAQGIGRATAECFADGGARVVVVDRIDDQARDRVEAMRERGLDVSLIVADLETADGVASAVAETVATLGWIDTWVNNVGGAIRVKPFVEFSYDEVEAEIRRSLWPTLLCCKAVIPLMLERGEGAIVNVGSNSPRGILRAPYATAKGGVIALTTCLAEEYADRGIRVNCVAPGATRIDDRIVPRGFDARSDQDRQWRDDLTDYLDRSIPMRRWGTAEEQASAIAFLGSRESSFITGQILSVAGGSRVP